MKIYILVLLFILVSSSTFSQVGKKNIPIKPILSPGLIYQNQFMGELNVMFSRLELTTGGSAIWGPRIGLESGFNKDKFIIAPKVGYELSGLLFCIRGSALTYFQANKVDVRFLPEIGLSLSGALNLCYGYNFHLFNDKIDDVTSNRISLTLNLDFELWRGL